MKLRKYPITILLVPVLILCLISSRIDADTSGADFLKIPVSARLAGLSSVCSADNGDPDSSWLNPASGAVRLRLFSVTHTEFRDEFAYEHISAAFPLKKAEMIFHFVFFHVPFDWTGETGEPLGNYTVYDLCLSGVLQFRLGGIKFGASLKGIYRSLVIYSAWTAALDVGAVKTVRWENKYYFNAGVAVKNMGPPVRFIETGDPLPLSIASGISAGQDGLFGIYANYEYRIFEKTGIIGLGIEGIFLNLISARTGFEWIGKKINWTGGIGLQKKFKAVFLSFDYGLQIRSGINENPFNSFTIKAGF